jgi:hypothetical protein
MFYKQSDTASPSCLQLLVQWLVCFGACLVLDDIRKIQVYFRKKLVLIVLGISWWRVSRVKQWEMLGALG